MIERWARERPDLDASSLAIVARVTRLARAIVETPMLNGSTIRLDAGQRFTPK